MSSVIAKQSPVFVLNPCYSGIGIARNLHPYSIDVYGLAASDTVPGRHSRFFRDIYSIPDSHDREDALCTRLIHLRGLHPRPPVLFPTRDFDVLFLHKYRKELSPFYIIPQPAGDSIVRLLDKLETALIADKHGIPAPKTASLSLSGNIDEQLSAFIYPLILKPRSSYIWRDKAIWRTLGARKAIIIDSYDHLRSELPQLAAAGDEVLVQEYIGGSDSNIAVCGCYIGPDNRQLGYFTAVKLLQSPPLSGTGCIVATAKFDEIVDISKRLLECFNYRGIAEIEFKYNRERREYFLIEVNPRHWDQHELSRFVGVNLTWIAYQDSIGESVSPQKPHYPRNWSCKWIAERETLLLFMQTWKSAIVDSRNSNSTGLFHVLRSLLEAVRASVRHLKGPRLFAVLNRTDPYPGLHLFKHLINEIFHIIMKRAPLGDTY